MIDVEKLKEAQEELNKRSSGGSKNWIQCSKIGDDPIDVRIMDPLPSMDGLYYVEVPMWWVNGKRIISSKLFGPAESDVVEDIIEEVKKSKDPTLKKLLSAVGENGPKIQKKVEFWIPVLKFNWELDKKNLITGIYNAKNEPDVEFIKKFIEDDKVKIMVVPITLLKAINEIATKRGGGEMTDSKNGFNISISKTGKERKTRYGAVKMDALPMPPEFYTIEHMVDPFEIAQSLMITDEYAELIVNAYFYGEALPDITDEDYEYPDIRQKLKDRFSEKEDDQPKAERRRLSLREQRGTEKAAEPVRERRAAAPPPPPVIPPPPIANDDLATSRRPAGRPVGRPKRSLVDDIADID